MMLWPIGLRLGRNAKPSFWKWQLCFGGLSPALFSANLSGQCPATDAPQALKDIGLDADVVVDDGVSPGGIASTVVKVGSDGALQILRQGGVAVSRDSK